MDLRIGTFLPRLPVRPPMADLVGLLSAEPLVAVAWDGQPAYRLADSVTEAEDGRSLTVRLKRDVRFHSGDLITAPVVAELLRAKLKRLAVKDVSHVVVTDEHTLVLHIHRPHSFKAVDLSAFVIDDDNRVALRAGPFKLVSVEPTVVLERFDRYYQGSPVVKRVEIKQYASHRAAWIAMMRGEVNFLHEVSRDAIEFIAAGGDIQAYPLLRPFYVPLVFNMRHPVLQRRAVRLALAEAVDRTEVVRNAMRGNGEVAEGPFWPHHWAYPQGRDPATYNPEAAKIRLDAAGLPFRSRSSVRDMPSRFAFTCLIPQGDARFERIALVVQRQLFGVGVDMALQQLPLTAFLDRIVAGDFEAFLFEMSTGRTLNFPYEFWHSKGPRAMSGYAAADAALDRMKLASTEDEVRLAVLDAIRILREDPPAIFLAMPREVRAADRSFTIPYDPDRDVFGSLWLARPASAMIGQRR